MKEGSSPVPDEEWKKFSQGAEGGMLAIYREEVTSRLHDFAEYLGRTAENLPNRDLMIELANIMSEAVMVQSAYAPDSPKEKSREQFVGAIGNALRQFGYTTVAERELEKYKGSNDLLESQLREAAADEAAGKPVRQGEYLPLWLTSRAEAMNEIARLRPWSIEQSTTAPRDEREAIRVKTAQIYTRFPDLPDTQTIEETMPRK